jgi:hypothetical protein
MNVSSSGAADALLANQGRRHASAYRKGGTNHSNINKRAMPSADNELALCSNLAHLDLRRVAESLSRQHHNGGSIGSVASTTSTASSTTTFADIDDNGGGGGDDGSVNYGRMRKRRRHSRTHNAYGSHDFQGILQSLFQRGDDGNQPSAGVSGGAEGAPLSAAMGAMGNIMDDLASPQHF